MFYYGLSEKIYANNSKHNTEKYTALKQEKIRRYNYLTAKILQLSIGHLKCSSYFIALMKRSDSLERICFAAGILPFSSSFQYDGKIIFKHHLSLRDSYRMPVKN